MFPRLEPISPHPPGCLHPPFPVRTAAYAVGGVGVGGGLRYSALITLLWTRLGLELELR